MNTRQSKITETVTRGAAPCGDGGSRRRRTLHVQAHRPHSAPGKASVAESALDNRSEIHAEIAARGDSPLISLVPAGPYSASTRLAGRESERRNMMAGDNSALAIRRECLRPATAGWAQPTGPELREVVRLCGMTGSQVEDFLGMSSNNRGRQFRRWISEDANIPYSAWALLCARAGLGNIWEVEAAD